MEYSDYLTKLEAIKIKCVEAENELLKIFIDSHNPYKVGDIFTDHIGHIRIEQIRYLKTTSTHTRPCAVYVGEELNKDKTPYKKRSMRKGYQFNDIINKVYKYDT